MFIIGMMYKDGFGVPQNKGEAERWFRKAADNGYRDAIQELAAIKSAHSGDTAQVR